MDSGYVRSRSIGAVLVGTMAIAAAQPINAAWRDRSGELPGMESGKSIAITAAVIGGGAVGGFLLYKKFRGPASKLETPGTMEFSGAGEKLLVVQNKGNSPISISEVSFQSDRFELAAPLKTPAIISAGSVLELPIRMTRPGSASARVQFTYIENGKERTKFVTLRGKAPSVAASGLVAAPSN
jgi:hypothetical protein